MKLCLFSSYSEASHIAVYVKKYIELLKPHFDLVTFITNERSCLCDLLGFDNDSNIKILKVQNEGHDFGMYLKALKEVDQTSVSELCLVNDSCIPLGSFDSIFEWFRVSDLEYAGLTDCHQTSYYIQSYFLMIQGNALKPTFDYFKEHGIQNRFSDVVRIYERGLTSHLQKRGCKTETYFDSKNYDGEYIELDCAEKLIEDGFPLIKKKLITKKLRNFQRYRLEKRGYNLDYDYKKCLKDRIPNLECLLEGIYGSEELPKTPKVSIIIDSNRSNELSLTDHYSYKNFDILSLDRLISKNSPDKINSEYFLFLGNNSDILPNSIYRFIYNALNTDSDLLYSNEMILKDGSVIYMFEKSFKSSELPSSYNLIGESFLVKNCLIQEITARSMNEFCEQLIKVARNKFHINEFLIKTSDAKYLSGERKNIYNQSSPFGWSNKFSAPSGSSDLLSKGVRNLKSKLSNYQNPKVALYGAGQHTERLLNHKDITGIDIIKIFDDFSQVKSINGIQVIHPQKLNTEEIDIVAVSSDTIEEKLLEQLLKKRFKNITIMSIYSDIEIKL